MVLQHCGLRNMLALDVDLLSRSGWDRVHVFFFLEYLLFSDLIFIIMESLNPLRLLRLLSKQMSINVWVHSNQIVYCHFQRSPAFHFSSIQVFLTLIYPLAWDAHNQHLFMIGVFVHMILLINFLQIFRILLMRVNNP